MHPRWTAAGAVAALMASTSAGAAQDLVAQASAPGRAVQAGIAGAVRGKVERAAQGAIGIAVKSGESIFLGDRITTGPDAGLQIILLDETVFTIGPNAAMAVDKFVYDPQSGGGTVNARIVQGAFRFVSGKVARANPKDMTIDLPNGTIGIRGTAGEGHVEGQSALVVLRGPGPNNNAGEREGRITVGGQGGEVLITRPGFATVLEGGNAPVEPARLTSDQQSRLTRGFAPQPQGGAQGQQGQQPQGQQQGQQGQPQNQQQGVPGRQGDQGQQDAAGKPGEQRAIGGAGEGLAGGGALGRQSGQGTAGALRPINVTGVVNRLNQVVNQQTVRAAQESTANFQEATTFEQIRGLRTGSATFSLSNIPLAATAGTGNGTYNLTTTVNFGALTGNVVLTGNFNLGGVPWTLNANRPLNDLATRTGVAADKLDPFPSSNATGAPTANLFLRATNDVPNRRVFQFLEHKLEIADVGRNNVVATQGTPKAGRH